MITVVFYMHYTVFNPLLYQTLEHYEREGFVLLHPFTMFNDAYGGRAEAVTASTAESNKYWRKTMVKYMWVMVARNHCLMR